MHHNNLGNFYTREIYAIPIPIGFIPSPIPIMSRMAIPIPMGFPWGFPLPCTPQVSGWARTVPMSHRDNEPVDDRNTKRAVQHIKLKKANLLDYKTEILNCYALTAKLVL